MQRLSDILTIVVLVKNEEMNLPECLENLEGFRHVVVVDSGSTDNTLKIAEAAEREILQFKWNGHFPKKRNWVLQNYAFKTPWVLFLDADERITPAWIAEAERLLANCPGTDAFICYYDNWFLNHLLKHGDAMRKTTVLRLGAGGYEHVDENNWTPLDMEIHEHLQVKGRIGVIRARLEHHDQRCLLNYCQKHREYAIWEARRSLSMRGNFKSLNLRQRIKYSMIGYWWFGPAYFLMSYAFMLGFLDGRIGFTFARCKMRYFMDVRKQLKEMTRS